MTGATEPERWSEVYEAEPMSVREARHFVAESPAASGIDPDGLAMAVSELASNAVLHARTPFEVRVERLADGIRIEVRDGNPTLPVARSADPSAVTGRGLMIVDSVSRAWDAAPTADGKVVWFEIGRRDR